MSKFALVLSLLLPLGAGAEFLTFDNREDWENNWTLKPLLNVFDEEGNLGLVKFRKDINALANAGDFRHPTQERDEVAGGIWEAKSSPETADFLVDGDPQTFWQPDPADAPDQWSVQLDLGRPVLARHIRLVFPDREGARPLRLF